MGGLQSMEHPPAAGRGFVDWYAITEKARALYGTEQTWVQVPHTLNKSMARSIRKRQVRAVDPDIYEVAARKAKGEGPTRAHLFIRVKPGAL